ncbi:MAG: hypothetical protein H0T78_03180, partial [Longispora sp.]|nr:hypothetical protein [Longispora sp. (in: high G+C Gram-positive bacteria)]
MTVWPGLRGAAMDAMTAVKYDHQLLKELFSSLRENAADIDRAFLLTEVQTRLAAHNLAAERAIIPALSGIATGQSDDADHEIGIQIQAGVDGLRKIEEKFTELQWATDDEFDVALVRLSNAVDVH